MTNSMHKTIGNLTSSDDLVLKNLRLVVHIAKQYQNLGLSLDDLIHEGTIGLCRARELYKDDKGKFSSYAGLWIKALIRQALTKNRIVKAPYTEETPVIINSYKDCNNIEEEAQAETQMSTDEISYKIELLLGKLSHRQKEIVTLKWGLNGTKELSTAEISEKLNLTVQAVNGNIRNAIQIMKKSAI